MNINFLEKKAKEAVRKTKELKGNAKQAIKEAEEFLLITDSDFMGVGSITSQLALVATLIEHFYKVYPKKVIDHVIEVGKGEDHE